MKSIVLSFPLWAALVNSQTTPAPTPEPIGNNVPQTTQFSYPAAANPGCDSFSLYSSLQPTGFCVADGSTSSSYECTANGTINYNVYASTDCSGTIVYTMSDYCQQVDAGVCVEYCNTGFQCDVAAKQQYFNGNCSAPDNTMPVILENCIDIDSSGVSYQSKCEYGVLSDKYYIGAGCQGNAIQSTPYPSGNCVHGNETVGVCGNSQYNGTYPPTTTTMPPELMDPGCNSFAVPPGVYLPAEICQTENDTMSYIATCNPDGTMNQARFTTPDCSGPPAETRWDVCNVTNSALYNFTCTAFCDSGLVCDTVLLEEYEQPFNGNDTACDEPIESNMLLMGVCMYAGGFTLQYDCDVSGKVNQNFYASSDCSGAPLFSQTNADGCTFGNETVGTCLFANNSVPLYTALPSMAPTPYPNPYPTEEPTTPSTFEPSLYPSMVPTVGVYTTYLPDSTTTTTTTDAPDTTIFGDDSEAPTGEPTIEPTVVLTQVSDTTSTTGTSTTLDFDDSSAWQVSVFMAVFIGFIGSIFL